MIIFNNSVISIETTVRQCGCVVLYDSDRRNHVNEREVNDTTIIGHFVTRN